MHYEFNEWEREPEPKASASNLDPVLAPTRELIASSRIGGPPRKVTGIGIIDPPMPPKRHDPLLPLAGSFVGRIFAAVILIGILGAILLLLLSHR